ncbi:MFS transporter [Mycobacterium sp. IS-2888]|uniref:MFS transporter n=1 Tax=Mycobacterium sp. IS-2888 TaxID=1834159 RepID=UPI00096CF570|nr:MFS transporter [Mycobacterium sp. IS-2888]OMC49902.1 MFS transporter [Mycobacterium sp. IS-2888]
MISSDVRTGRPSPIAVSDQRRGSDETRAVFTGVLVLLLSTGWVANHFVALMPLIGERQHLGAARLDAIFGIYALGLLPGLLVGGRVSDALGRQSVALAGSTTAIAGTLAMLVSQHADVLLMGRLIVGIGVGLLMSSCTAWASDLKGPAGAATAGAVLLLGFAIGPFTAGVIARAGQPGVRVSFGLAAAIVVLAMAITVVAVRRTGATAPATERGWEPSVSARQGTAWALSWAMPLAPWVFASATLGFIAIPTRVHTGLAAPMAVGAATLIVNGVSGLIQVLARVFRWGPHAGTAGAVLAALGYAVTAAAPPTISLALGLPLFVVLGCASGLCLREGLIDLEAAAPQRIRGALVGVFYVVTYVGFGLPLVLTTVGSGVSATILAVMAVLALATAVSRAVRLRRDAHRPS